MNTKLNVVNLSQKSEKNDLKYSLLALIQSFVYNTFDYFLVFIPLLLVYKLYKKHHDRIRQYRSE